MKTIQPKCLNGQQELGHTARGYVLPCCWWDVPFLFDSEIKELVKEKFRLNNASSINEILQSEEWKTFYQDLKKGNAPSHCYKFCSGKEVKSVKNTS